MKTILLVASTYVSFHVFLRELASRLQRDSWEVHLATCTTNYPGEHDDESGSEITLHEVDFPRGASLIGHLRAARQLRQVVQLCQPDIIHAHLHPAILATALGRTIAWPPTLGTFQGLVGPPERGLKGWLYDRIERWAARRLDRVWVVNECDVRSLPLANVHLQSSPGFGADQTRFDPDLFSPSDRAEFRGRYGIPEDALVFTFVGRLTRFKGFPEAALAAYRVAERHPLAYFLFVGTDDPRHPDGLTGTQRHQIENHCQIRLLGWNDDIPRLLYASDCFVFPSAREGLAVCIMEALSMGLPVITTSARGCGDLVSHGHNGWIVEKTDQSVLQRILKVCAHPKLLPQFKERILAEREQFSREHFLVEQMEIYRRILESA